MRLADRVTRLENTVDKNINTPVCIRIATQLEDEPLEPGATLISRERATDSDFIETWRLRTGRHKKVRLIILQIYGRPPITPILF